MVADKTSIQAKNALTEPLCTKFDRLMMEAPTKLEEERKQMQAAVNTKTEDTETRLMPPNSREAQ